MAEKNINSASYWDERWTKSPAISRKLEKVICSLVDPDTSVLDIGCGTGRVIRGLRKDKRCKVFGVDISPVAIATLRRYGIGGLVMDVNDFSDRTPYDVVILSHTLEHVSDDKQLIWKVAQNTKKYCIIAVPNDCMGPEEEPEHMRKYSKESLEKLVKPYFKRIEDHSVGVHLILKCYA